jgi:exodeoxyribonuclease VII large subunit
MARARKLLLSRGRAIVDPLNVSQFLAAYDASLANVLELKASMVTGILEPKGDKIYGGKLYWDLVDNGARLTVLIPEYYRDLSGRRVEAIGQPTRRRRKDRGDIQVILDVENMNPLDPTPEDWIGPLRPIGEKRRSSWPAIERFFESRILTGDQPRVLMFFGASSIEDKDVRAALGQHAGAYHIEERRIPLTNPTAVAAALSVQKVNADLVAIVRGGGDGISALSDRHVIDAVAHHMPIPIVSAVGHAADRPLIQDLVHQAFPTPTALGTWLAARATDALQARDAVAFDRIREREVMQRQLRDLTEAVRAAKLAQTAAWEAVAKAREEAGVQRRRVRHLRALLFLALAVLVLILVALW